MIARHRIVKLTVLIKQKRRDSSYIQRIYKYSVRSSIYNKKIDFSPVRFLCEGLNLSRQYLAGGSPVSPYFNDNGEITPQNFRLKISFTQLFHSHQPLSPPGWSYKAIPLAINLMFCYKTDPIIGLNFYTMISIP